MTSDEFDYVIARSIFRTVGLLLCLVFSYCAYTDTLDYVLIKEQSAKGLCKVDYYIDSKGNQYRSDDGWVRCGTIPPLLARP